MCETKCELAAAESMSFQVDPKVEGLATLRGMFKVPQYGRERMVGYGECETKGDQQGGIIDQIHPVAIGL